MNLLKLTQTIIQKLGYDETTGTIIIEADNLRVKDAVLQLNSSEEGPGITGGVSGIEISRGPGQEPAKLYFSEEEQCFKSTLNTDTRVLGLTLSQVEVINNIVENPAPATDPFDKQKFDTEMYLDF